MRLRIRGAGEAGPNGGPPGDLYVVVHLAEHPVFEREGNNLWIDAPISFTQAALGTQIYVTTMDGNALVTVPPGTQTGTVLRLKGRGLPDLRGYGTGDEFVRVTVVTPTKLSVAQKELLKQFGESTGDYQKGASKKGVFGRFRNED